MSIFMVGSIISPIYLPLVGILTMVLAVVLYIQTIKLILANAVFHNEIDLINSSERKVENVTESDAIEVKE